jgi:bifunctional NMN adenylyltransferase/nudix hydrolase
MNTASYKKYKAQWSVAPYPPVFVTTDALVINKGHILLIKRGLNPGKGLWALPGGFLNPNESITDCAVRELKEETKIDVPVPVLKGSITKTEMFDHPNRDPRGRVITHCFRFDVTYGKGRELIKIKAGDDAVGAQWVPIGDLLLMRKTFFSDHFQIIRKMLGL